MLTSEQRAQGWKEHDGGPCPVVDDAAVALIFRDGECHDPAEFMAWHWDWEHSPNKGALDDIIAYREVPHD